MPETQNLKQPPKIYKIKIWPRAWQSFLFFSKRLFNFFSLRKSRQFWGIVYDSVSKQPLDPVIVKLLYTDGREVETCVTDLSGRYGFLARPGKFKIYARKTNYTFPSLYAPGQQDGIYGNLYHGEFFTLSEISEVLAPNIPMDPIRLDWNQQAKRELVNSYPYVELFFKRLIAVVFWFGLGFLALLFWKLYPNAPDYIYWLALGYAILFLLRLVLPEPRLWGRLVADKTDFKPEKIFLELLSARFTDISFGKAQVHENGRFLLRAAKGSYILSVSFIGDRQEKVFLGALPVRIGSPGVLSATVEIN